MKEGQCSSDKWTNRWLSHYIKPHKPVTSQRIAHWIKDLLGQAGVDTSVSKAHSVRGAVLAAALNKGVTLAEILQAAEWSSDTNFRRFYYRLMSSTSFGRGILDVRKQVGKSLSSPILPCQFFQCYVLFWWICEES